MEQAKAESRSAATVLEIKPISSLPWVKHKRENGISYFEFKVTDPVRAFAAVRDVKGLINAASGRLSVWLLSSLQVSQAYAAIGFPPRKKSEPLEIRLDHGAEGQIGARFSYRFPYTAEGFGQGQTKDVEALVSTEIVQLVDEFNRKEVVLRTKNTSESKLKNGWFDCLDCLDANFFKPETETKFTFALRNGEWKVLLSHNGFDSFDVVDYEGYPNFVARMACTHLLCPCMLPCLPCSLNKERKQLNEYLAQQLLSMRDYMNTYEAQEKTICSIAVSNASNSLPSQVHVG